MSETVSGKVGNDVAERVEDDDRSKSEIVRTAVENEINGVYTAKKALHQLYFTFIALLGIAAGTGIGIALVTEFYTLYQGFELALWLLTIAGVALATYYIIYLKD